MSTEFNVSPFKIFVLITLEVKETKHTLLITFTLLLIGWSNFLSLLLHRPTENSKDNLWPKLHDCQLLKAKNVYDSFYCSILTREAFGALNCEPRAVNSILNLLLFWVSKDGGCVLLTACDMSSVHCLMQILTAFFFIFWCLCVSVYCPLKDFAQKAKSRGGTLVIRAYIKESTYSWNIQSVCQKKSRFAWTGAARNR